jgi:MFS family permease
MRLPRTIIALGLVSLFNDLASEIVVPLIPILLTTVLGAGPVALGVIEGVADAVAALLKLWSGRRSDALGGRRKGLTLAGYLLSNIARPLLGLAGSWAGVLVLRSVDRVGKGLRTAPRDALIADVTEPHMLGRAFGVHRALDTLGAAIGPLAAFAVLLAVPGGYRSIWVVSFAFAVVGVAVLVLAVPDRRTDPGSARPAARRLLRAMVAAPLRGPLVAFAVLGLCTVGDGFLYLSLQRRDGFAALWFPLLYVGTNVSYLCLAVPLGRLADRVGRARVFVAGHVALLLGYLAAALPTAGTGWTVATLLLLGVFYAATDGVLSALVSRLMPAGTRGTGLAAAQTVVVLARFASSVAFGGLWALVGPRAALLLAAAVLAAAIPAAGWLLRGAGRTAADRATEPG